MLLRHLLEVKSRHWDESVRLLAAQAASSASVKVWSVWDVHCR